MNLYLEDLLYLKVQETNTFINLDSQTQQHENITYNYQYFDFGKLSKQFLN